MKRVLIIGGTGYIGSRLYQYLSGSYEYDVTTVDLEWFGNHVNPNNIKIDYADLTKELISIYDVVILLAGYSSPTQCQNSGMRSVIVNNFVNFVDLVGKLSPHQKFIYASSITVYEGQGDKEILSEDSKLGTSANSYELTKRLCDEWIATQDVEYYGLRLATVGGASLSFREDIMVNAMTMNALSTGEVTVFNPDNYKPMLFIGDLMRAIKRIIDSPLDKRGFYNMVSYNGTVRDIAQEVAIQTNAKLTTIKSDQMQRIGLPTTAYDLCVSPMKFRCFGYGDAFVFHGSTKTMVQEILTFRDILHPSKRIDGIRYI